MKRAIDSQIETDRSRSTLVATCVFAGNSTKHREDASGERPSNGIRDNFNLPFSQPSMKVPMAIRITVTTLVLLASVQISIGQETTAIRATRAAGPLGVQPYVRGHWGVVRTSLYNPTDQEASVEVLTTGRSAPHRQYGRRFWMPPKSRLTSWYPIHVSAQVDPAAKVENIDSIVWDRTGSKPILVPQTTKRRLRSGQLRLSERRRITAFIGNDQLNPTERQRQHADDCMLAIASLRVIRFGKRRVASFQESLPVSVHALDNVEHLVVFNNRIARDVAALTAIRRWVQAGGRLWIIMDQVDPDTVGALLGDAQPFELVDRVELNEFQLRTTDRKRWGEDSKLREFEQPVPFARVLARDVDVTHTINGWPAAIWQKYGRGGILFTFLGVRGWLRAPTEIDAVIKSKKIGAAPIEPLQYAASRLMAERPREDSPVIVFDDYLSGQIGYRTVDRSTVAIVLGGFCGLLLLGSIWLSRRRQLDRMLWLAPTAALAATVVLVAIGRQARQSTEETAAVAQFVRVEPESEEISIEGRLALYTQDNTDKTIAFTNGGRIDQSFAEQSMTGTTRKMIWTDIGRSSWSDMTVPAGVQMASFEFEKPATTTIKATGSLGPNGFAGRLQVTPFEEPADAVLSNQTPFPLSVRIQSDGTITAGIEQSLVDGNYLSGTLLTDEQRRRQEVYRKLLGNAERRRKIQNTTLYVWTRALPMGFDFGEVRRTGSALLAIPLQLARTAPDTRVSIPAAFLPYRGAQSPTGKVEPTAFSIVEDDWIERDVPTRTWLRIQLPTQVLPLTVKKLIVTVQFAGAQRPFVIAGVVDGKIVTLKNVNEPLAKNRVELENAAALKPDADGHIIIGIDVRGKKTPGRYWRFASVRFDIEGTTAAAD